VEPVEFGKYLLLQQIGIGRIGQVWKAKVLGVKGLEKFLAIKRLHPHLSTEKAVIDIFMEAASSLVHLQHENIVRVYDFGTAEGTPYLAMDFILGKNLAQFAMALRDKGQALGVEEALHIAIEVCKALDFAHTLQDSEPQSEALIHAGVRPQNVLITKEGEVKLTDFCISRALFEGLEDKQGVFEKTLPYLAPEVVKGEPIGPEVDVFCLGVLFCELLTGRPLMEGAPSELLGRLSSDEWNPIQVIPEDLAPSAQEILAKAMAPDPNERYRTAGQMLQDLEKYAKEIGAKAETESLARFMDTLFGEELVKTMEVAGEAEEEQAGISPEEEIVPPGGERAPQKGGLLKNKAVLGAGLGVIVVLVIALFMFWPGQKKGEHMTPRPSETQQQLAEKKATAEVTAAQEAQGPTESSVETTQLESRPAPAGEEASQAQGATEEEVFKPEAVEQANPKVELALKALEEEQYGKAAKIFEEVLSEDPQLRDKIAPPYAEALVGEAIKIEDKNPKKARKLLLKAVELNPESVEGNFHLGLLYAEAKNYAKAIERYNRVTELDPQYADAYFNLGYIYAVTKKWNKAESMYEQVVRLAPPYLDEALFNLAMVQKRLGKRDACVENLKKAVIVNPKNNLAKKYLKKMTGK